MSKKRELIKEKTQKSSVRFRLNNVSLMTFQQLPPVVTSAGFPNMNVRPERRCDQARPMKRLLFLFALLTQVNQDSGPIMSAHFYFSL